MPSRPCRGLHGVARRNWRRTLIATIAIILSMFLLIFFQAFMDGTDQAIYGNTVRLYGGNVLIHAPGYRDKSTRLPMLPVADVDAIRERVVPGTKLLIVGAGYIGLEIAASAVQQGVEVTVLEGVTLPLVLKGKSNE